MWTQTTIRSHEYLWLLMSPQFRRYLIRFAKLYLCVLLCGSHIHFCQIFIVNMLWSEQRNAPEITIYSFWLLAVPLMILLFDGVCRDSFYFLMRLL